MQILHMCPANIATGGTDSIHRLVRELCRCGADAKILYVNGDLRNPMPGVYKKYECEYLTSIPSEFDGLVILPEIWADRCLDEDLQRCAVAVNWQGVDVYRWNNPQSSWYRFLQRKNILHFTNMKYGMEFLKNLGLNPIKVSDCVDDIFFDSYIDGQRSNKVLYNSTRAKMTKFQEIVMARTTTERGIRFIPIEHYTQTQLVELFRHSKLYIDFGEFSGRERLPRETVLCGCCVLTSNNGASSYYEDVMIDDKYKVTDTEKAIDMIAYIVQNYELCKPDFDAYRQSLIQDRENYSKDVKELYNEILNNYSSI